MHEQTAEAKMSVSDGIVETLKPMPSDVDSTPVRGDMVSELRRFKAPHARLLSTKVDDRGTSMITATSSPVEGDRQIMLLRDMVPGKQRHRSKKPSAVDSLVGDSMVRSFTDMVGITTDTQRACAVVVGETNPVNMTAFECRKMRVQLSMDDPSISQVYRSAHRRYVSGCSLADMRSHGCTMRHLVGIGVSYDEWTQQCGYGLKEVAFMGGSWNDVVDMGFSPQHISDRDKNGAVLLRDSPFGVTWDDIEHDVGITVDEAVFEAGFNTSDFAMLGESLRDMILRGFGPLHAERMGEPASNFEYTLGASASDLNTVFPCKTKPKLPGVYQQQRNQTSTLTRNQTHAPTPTQTRDSARAHTPPIAAQKKVHSFVFN